ncbi:hypothetical protein M407DRAFT_32218 [Tulasnella calospora MUT 4182]|uniref:Uncharacterized protein n=1 Tax=Tulasnella calospora MUT 4182 TaxID=1051891 RepID=A0A0C3Q4C3_9AGAM|nr:hypothetical protein M407DRAFT_32218 [Tulasnella calospora MUT 4182]
MQISSYQSLFQLWFLTFLRTLLTSVQQLFRRARTMPPASPPPQCEPGTDAPTEFKDPIRLSLNERVAYIELASLTDFESRHTLLQSNHERYLSLETSAFPSKPFAHIPQACYKDILALINGPLPALTLGDDHALAGAKVRTPPLPNSLTPSTTIAASVAHPQPAPPPHRLQRRPTELFTPH